MMKNKALCATVSPELIMRAGTKVSTISTMESVETLHAQLLHRRIEREKALYGRPDYLWCWKWVLIDVWNAGRIQGIQEERARRRRTQSKPTP